MEEVNVDATTAVTQMNKQHKTINVGVGVIFAATALQNLDILKLLLEHVQEPVICLVESTDLGIPPLPLCLQFAVKRERLDVLDALLEKADMLGKGARVTNCFGEDVKPFSPFYCLIMAVDVNKPVVFKHLLTTPCFQDQVNVLQHQHFALQGRHVTLLEFILLKNRAEMHELLTEKIVKDANSAEYGMQENLKKEKIESEPGSCVEEIAGQDGLVDKGPIGTERGDFRKKDCEAENKMG